jgi:hypothetical protein
MSSDSEDELEDDRPPRHRDDLEKTMKIFSKIKDIRVENDGYIMSVGNQLANDFIYYHVQLGERKYSIMRRYNRDSWIIYLLGPPADVCITTNENSEKDHLDLLPTNWFDKSFRIPLPHFNAIIDKFNKEAKNLL